MALTKRDIVDQAFEEIGLGPYQYDIQPEDRQTGLKRLDNLMAEWASKGIETGYPVATDPSQSDLDQAAGVSSAMVRGIVAQVAVDIAPGYGKTASPDTKISASLGYDNALRLSVVVPNKAINTQLTPSGAGYKPRWRHDLRDESGNDILPGERTRS